MNTTRASVLCALIFVATSLATSLDAAPGPAAGRPYPCVLLSGRAVPRVRPLRRWLVELLERACARSETLERILGLVDRTDLVVLLDLDVEAAPRAPWDGRTRLLGLFDKHRYVHVALRRQSPDLMAALTAHELQHALEIAGADVVDDAGFRGLFTRIGFPVAGSLSGLYETEEAVDVGIATLRELTGSPVRPGPRTARALQARRLDIAMSRGGR